LQGLHFQNQPQPEKKRGRIERPRAVKRAFDGAASLAARELCVVPSAKSTPLSK
jgi:hypothetical protein